MPGYAVEEGHDQHVVFRVKISPRESAGKVEVVPPHARHVGRIDDLHMRKRIVLRGNAISGAGGLDRVDRRTHTGIAYRMDMNVEAGEVELLDELHLDGAFVLKLTAREGALVGVKAVRLNEGGGSRRFMVLGAMGPHILANRRIRIDITGY